VPDNAVVDGVDDEDAAAHNAKDARRLVRSSIVVEDASRPKSKRHKPCSPDCVVRIFTPWMP
jgi:hypothetical protein